MTHWLFPANAKIYDVFGAFAEEETFWPRSAKAEPGDTVFIYLAAPHKQIGFICDVLEVGFDMESVMDRVQPFLKGDGGGKKEPKAFMKLATRQTLELSSDSLLGYAHLKEQGLTGMLMGPRKLENNPDLLTYIQGVLK